MKTLLTISLIGFAFVLGLVAPDVDQRLPFLTHRSLLTHGPWFAVLATWLAQKARSRWLAQKARSRSAVPLIDGSFVIGLALHLAFDLFPKAWMGFALVHIPFWGRLPAAASVCWLIMSLVVSAACAVFLGWRAIPKQE